MAAHKGPCKRFSTQDTVFPYLKTGDKLRVLAHYAYPGGKGVGGQPKTAFLPVDQGMPRTGEKAASHNVHQSRFPRPIFAKQRVYLPFFERKISSFQGMYSIVRKIFPNILQFYHVVTPKISGNL
jgi:hypothetical protein